METLDDKRKRIAKKSLFDRLTHRFRFQVIDENELRVVRSFMASRLDGIVLSVFLTAIIVFLSILLFQVSPMKRRTADKDYMLRQQIVDGILRIDSLEEAVNVQELYFRSLQRVMTGKISLDSVYSIDSLVQIESVLLDTTPAVERAFVGQFEEREQYSVTQSVAAGDVRTRNLFRPVSGIVSEPYDALNGMYGVGIATSPKENVLAVMDGTVILANYTAEDGYVICINHGGDLTSVYRNCKSLLKKPGDKVKAGDVIALIGGTGGKDSSNPRLHVRFELWYEGQSLDPQQYIVFQ